MSSMYSASSSAGPSRSSSSRRPPPPQPKTLEPETAFERHKRQWAQRQTYEGGRKAPGKPSRSELDVLKERHQFVRDSNVDPSTLSWEDMLAEKYYASLFREYALVSLERYKEGAIALRWRTEPELLAGVGVQTCASLSCKHHQPSAAILARLDLDDLAASADPDDAPSLVDANLTESEMQFGYVEDGERKSTLVKVVLCPKCREKLRRGRKVAREARERAEAGRVAISERAKGKRKEEEEEEQTGRRSRRSSETSSRRHGDVAEDEERRKRRRSAPEGASDERRAAEEDDSDYGPSLPPDLQQSALEDRFQRSHRRETPPPAGLSSSASSRTRRRPASPAGRG